MFYVSIIDGKRYALAAGPYPTHEEALERVDDVRRLCDRLDYPGAPFWGFGTCRLKGPINGSYPAGKLNGQLAA